MTDEMRAKLARLRSIAPELNAATDEAAKVVREVEKLLTKSLSLGVSAQAVYFDIRPDVFGDDDRTVEVCSALAYGRLPSDGYGIHILRDTLVKDEDGDVTDCLASTQTPWHQCSQEEKLTAFECLPELLDKIADGAEERLEKARATTARVRELVDALTDDAHRPLVHLVERPQRPKAGDA